MSECTHDCSNCGESCAEREQQDLTAKLNPAASVKKVIAVVSGKGGVGKSLVTSMMATEMQRRGHQAAVLDADVTGPSIPKAFGIHEHARGTEEMLIPCYSNKGTQIMSINLILDNETDPVVWRGPVIAGVVTQFWSDVLWDNFDYMFVDMPPGTSDVPLTAFQSFRLDGIVVVTSPQELVSMVVEKAINMAQSMDIKVLGLIENMSYVECPNCNEKIEIFGKSHINEVSEKYGLPVLAKIPMRQKVAESADEGTMEDLEIPEIKDAVSFIEGK